MKRLHCPSPFHDAVLAEWLAAERLAVAYVAREFQLSAAEVRNIIAWIRAEERGPCPG